jgi:hypothetical protein
MGKPVRGHSPHLNPRRRAFYNIFSGLTALPAYRWFISAHADSRQTVNLNQIDKWTGKDGQIIQNVPIPPKVNYVFSTRPNPPPSPVWGQQPRVQRQRKPMDRGLARRGGGGTPHLRESSMMRERLARETSATPRTARMPHMVACSGSGSGSISHSPRPPLL